MHIFISVSSRSNRDEALPLAQSLAKRSLCQSITTSSPTSLTGNGGHFSGNASFIHLFHFQLATNMWQDPLVMTRGERLNKTAQTTNAITYLVPG